MTRLQIAKSIVQLDFDKSGIKINNANHTLPVRCKHNRPAAGKP